MKAKTVELSKGRRAGILRLKSYMIRKPSHFVALFGTLLLIGTFFWSAPAFSATLAKKVTAATYPNVDRATALLKQKIATLYATKTTTKTAPTTKLAALPPVKKPTTSLPSPTATTIATLPPKLAENTQPKDPAIPTIELNKKVREALVNILCVTKAGGSLHPISGSGVIIDPRGIILTNAHVAQYMLLSDFIVPDFVSCVVRTGSPAAPTYKAKLMYLPKEWVTRNADSIQSTNPTGTGEHDYAFLVITENIERSVPFPTSFPYIAPNVTFGTPEINYPILIAGYPAEFVGGIVAQRELFAASSKTSITQGYYYPDSDPSALDLVDVGSSILAQGGSSGGAVVDHNDGSLIGLLVTTSSGTTTAEKELNAVTLSHIDRSLQLFEGKNLADFLAGNLEPKITSFETTLLPIEKKILINSVLKNR